MKNKEKEKSFCFNISIIEKRIEVFDLIGIIDKYLKLDKKFIKFFVLIEI